MARELYEIAKEIADETVVIARCAGYEVRSERELCIAALADDIADWLERHMQVERRHDPTATR